MCSSLFSVIKSIKPYWVYLILIGKKTVEVSKSFPRSKDWDGVVEVYCSKDIKSFNRIPKKDRDWMRKYLGKVACRFICGNVTGYEYGIQLPQDGAHCSDCYEGYSLDFVWDERHCLSSAELYDYGNKNFLYSWTITGLIIYDVPKELTTFKLVNKVAVACGYNNFNVYDRIITRPPQNWMYCSSSNLF